MKKLKNNNIKIKISNEVNELEFDCNLENNNSTNYLPCKVSINKNSNEEAKFKFFEDNFFQYLNAERIGAKSFYNYSLNYVKKNNIGNHG